MGLGAAMALGDPPADYASIATAGLFVALMCVCIIVGHLLEENRWMNESITTLFIGLGTRAVILFASSEKHSRVLVFSALGLISRLNIGALELGDYLALGATFSAIDSNFDPGNISGAKLLNFISSFLYLFGSSTILGVASGLLSAYTIKKLYFGRHSTYREVSIMMLMAYLSYMLAELLDLSGILTVFFCGVVMSHYTWHNVTESSRVTTKHAFATLSFISETFLFLYVGMDALDIEKWKIVGQTYRHTLSLFLSLHCSTRRSFF
ncbi:Sodium/hydrogen exchanger 2 [Zea mays]|uniref:Sodium/hydrogen exchanger 2 n=1 Tax=Zea mays TaxID=4577 RepID=A0A1D6JCQ5_MAIZE|nr:Sodium/hydrogen exchanger 2 [Zea mays]